MLTTATIHASVHDFAFTGDCHYEPTIEHTASDEDLYNHLVNCGEDPLTIDALIDIGHTIQDLYEDHVNAGLEPFL
jgi:hypothetical protein